MKFNIEDCRDFHFENAKSGAPYCQRNGLGARIGIWDGKNSECPLFGCYLSVGDKEILTSWTKNGKIFEDERESIYNLVMLPLGYCQGKPVHVGDVLLNKFLEKVVSEAGEHGKNYDALGYKWPPVEVEMPKCTIPHNKFDVVYMGTLFVEDVAKIITKHLLENQREDIEAYFKAKDEQK